MTVEAEPTEAIEHIFRAWDKALGAKDVEASIALYAEDATLESPFVRHLLGTEAGVVHGRQQLREFLSRVFAHQPPQRRRFRTGYLTDGTRLTWEYSRTGGDGKQMDIVEVMEIADVISHHRVYWGWYSLRLLDEERRTSREHARFVFDEWDRRARAGDVPALLGLYAEDATLESPLVPRVLDTPSGVLTGKQAIGDFFTEGTRRRPNDLVRWHRSGQFLWDGQTLSWEYLRATSEGDQVNISEVMDLVDGRIAAHRIYWGWFGTQMLIANALDKENTERRGDDTA